MQLGKKLLLLSALSVLYSLQAMWPVDEEQKEQEEQEEQLEELLPELSYMLQPDYLGQASTGVTHSVTSTLSCASDKSTFIQWLYSMYSTITKACDTDNSTLLHMIISRVPCQEQATCIHMALSYGADLNAKDAAGITPLMLAADKNTTQTMAVLLSLGAKVNATDNDGSTVLHRIAQQKHHAERLTEQLNQLYLILDFKGDIDSLDNRNRTPFLVAAEIENVPIMQALNTHRAYLNQLP